MKLTTAEAIVILTKHLGVDVEIVDDESTSGKGEWVNNTQTESTFPKTLNPDGEIEVIFSDDTTVSCYAMEMAMSWNIISARRPIVKYRKVN